MKHLFFILFVIAVLTCGSINIGPFSLRVYATVLMLFFLIIAYKKGVQSDLHITRGYIWLYLSFVIYLFIALVLNGGIGQYDYFRKALAYYLVCCVAFFAVDYFVDSYKQIRYLVIAFSLLILFDSLITILQFNSNLVGWRIGTFFRGIDQWSDIAGTQGVDVGVSILPGIFGHPVANAFFLAVTTPLLLSMLANNRSFLGIAYYLGVISLSVIACYYIQQRAAFFLLILILLFHFIKFIFTNKSPLLIPLTIIVVALVLFSFMDLSSFNWGRLTDSTNSDRQSLWNMAFVVINDYMILGNPNVYNSQSELSAHNVLLDSFVASGIIGFILMSILFFKTLFVSAVYSFINKCSVYSRVFAYSVFISMVMGLFHNTSYYTGEVIIFICLALLLKAEKFDHQEV